MSENRTTVTAHPQCTATSTVWLPESGAPVQQRGPFLVACGCAGPHHTEVAVTAKLARTQVTHEVATAWIATATGPNPTTAGEQATRVAAALGETLGEGD